MPLFEPKLGFIADMVAYVTMAVPIGPAAWGTRLICPVVRGTVEGPKIKGIVRPFGADWAIVRADDCIELDVRLIVETDDGALIHVEYGGVIDLTKEQVDRLRRGRAVGGMKIHTAPRFETAHPDYVWLNRIQAVGCGSGEVVGEELKVMYSWYALRS
ncbi:MAG: DUF3237 domain-containing protein [Thermodesulfobacteriota bacterium]